MYLLDSSNVWHVAKTGNDGNGGHAQQYPVALAADAKLTIGAAITAAAAGDTIIIWPGTYTEKVTVSKTLNIIGTSREKCIITQAADTALTFSASVEGSVLQSLSVISTDTGGTKYGIKLGNSNHHTQIIDVYCSGDLDGIHLSSSNNVYMKNVHGKGRYDGIQTGSGNNRLLENCTGETTGASTTTAYPSGIVIGAGTNCVLKNCTAYALRAINSDDYDLCGIRFEGKGVINNCSVYVHHTGTGAHKTFGILANTQTGIGVVSNCTVVAEADYGTVVGIGTEDNGILTIGHSTIYSGGSVYANGSCTAQVTGYEKTRFVDSGTLGTPPNDYWNTWTIEWVTGNNAGESIAVDDWDTDTDTFYFASAFTNDIEVGDAYRIVQYYPPTAYSLSNGGVNITVQATYYNNNTGWTNGTITQMGTGWAASVKSQCDSTVAAKILKNKAVQNKSTGVIEYYDDDGTTVVLTHIPTDGELTITRTPN